VQRVHLEVVLTDVGDVVPAPGGHEDDPVVGDLAHEVELILRGAHLDPTLPGLDAQELVVVVVDLETDVVPGLDAHDGELHVRSRPQRGAVVVVGEGGVLDVDDERVRTLIGGAHRCSCFFVDGCTRWPAASVPSRVSTTPGTLASKGILPRRGPRDLSPSRHGATTIR